jgi:hypothetical protein
MDIFKKTLLYVFISSTLFSCGGGGGDSQSTNPIVENTYNIESGVFQKGPFVAGTTVTIQELNDDLQPTGKSYTTTTDAIGRFSVGNVKSRFVEVFANGFYYDELTNKNSTAPITLRSILDLTTSATTPSINTLTTLQTERLRELKKSGKTFQDSQIESKNAVLNAFGIDNNTISNFNSINLLGSTKADESLIRATVALLEVAKSQGDSTEANLTVLISKLATDLKGDGQINDLAKDLILPIRKSQSAVDSAFINYRLKQYVNLKNNSQTDNIIGISSYPKLSEWLIALTSLSANSENIWMLRDDGSVWLWPSIQKAIPKKIPNLTNIVSLEMVYSNGLDLQSQSLIALDSKGKIYQIDKDTGAVIQQIVTSNPVKQITKNMYLEGDGTIHNWENNGLIPGIPLMDRLVVGKTNTQPFAKGGIGLDGQLYLFKGVLQKAGIFSNGTEKVGAYPNTESIVTIRTQVNPSTPFDFKEEWVSAILENNTWLILDKTGKILKTQKIPTSILSTNIDGVFIKDNIVSSSHVSFLDNDGYLWIWNQNNLEFAQQPLCAGIKKQQAIDLLLIDDSSFRADDTTVVSNESSTKFCQKKQLEDIKNIVITDVLGDSTRPVIVKSDGGLIGKFSTFTSEVSRPIN